MTDEARRLLERAMAVHESREGACRICHVPWPCQDVVGIRDVLDQPEPAQTGGAAREAGLIERLREFSVILAEEVTHGTLSLGFGPDWPAKKVQLAIDRLLLADTSLAAAALLAAKARLQARVEELEKEQKVSEEYENRWIAAEVKLAREVNDG